MPPQEDVLGRRVAAGVIDLVVLGVLFVVFAIAFGRAEAEDGSASVMLEGAPALLFFAVSLLYYLVLEATTGRTLGKALLGLRVTGEDGAPAGAGAVVVRTLLRIVDALPFLYLVGFVTLLATGQRRARVGDLAAKTRVIRSR